MKVSVIIPVFNSENYLPDLFAALKKNSFTKEDEIILVDNGSTDNSLVLCKNKEREDPSLYKVLEYKEKPGSYAARNYALQRAKGDVIIFTDSDTKPSASWVINIKKNISKGTVIAGKIYLEIVENGLWENFDSIAHLNSEKNAKDSQIATANMAVYKEDFWAVGLFEERFSGGDYEWSVRAVKSGMKIKFVSEALILHPTRKTFGQILKKEQRIAYGAGNHFKLNNESFIKLMVIYFLKIFKIDTNIRYTMQLKARGMKWSQLFEFNCYFMIIRVRQLLYAIKGFFYSDIRSTGVQ